MFLKLYAKFCSLESKYNNMICGFAFERKITVNIKLEHVTNQLWISELEVNKTRTVTKLRLVPTLYLPVLTCIYF